MMCKNLTIIPGIKKYLIYHLSEQVLEMIGNLSFAFFKNIDWLDIPIDLLIGYSSIIPDY